MTLDEIARTYGIEDQVRDMPDLRPVRHWAMPSARAATPSGPSLLRVSGIAGIAIATFAACYFIAQLARAVLS